MTDKTLEEQKADLLRDVVAAGPLTTEADRLALLSLFKIESFRKLLCAQLLTSDELLAQLCNADLSTDESVKRAIKTQAAAHLLSMFVEGLVDTALTKIEQKETE